jgi:ABC-2 type transport system permease protein
MLLARRGFLALLLIAWTPFLVRAVQLYAAATVPQAAFLAPTAATFREFLRQQDIFVFLVTVYAGAGLVANDRRVNALQIYLSKPITRADYIFGKFSVVAAFLLLITWLPATLLLIVQVAFAGDLFFLGDNASLFPAITAFSLVETVVASTSILALSSLSTSGRNAAILYAGLMFFSQVMFQVVRVATGDTWWSWMSMPDNVSRIGDAMFRLSPGPGPPWPVALVMLTGLVAAAGVVLARRVRAVEVVT